MTAGWRAWWRRWRRPVVLLLLVYAAVVLALALFAAAPSMPFLYQVY